VNTSVLVERFLSDHGYGCSRKSHQPGLGGPNPCDEIYLNRFYITINEDRYLYVESSDDLIVVIIRRGLEPSSFKEFDLNDPQCFDNLLAFVKKAYLK